MATDGGGLIRMELKYCERCGTLWLRPRGSEVSICAACVRSMAGLPGARRELQKAACEAQGFSTGIFWAEGGRA